jgi:hypothetical protein
MPTHGIGEGVGVGRLRFDDERIHQCRLGDLLLPGRSAHTVLGKRLLVVRGSTEFFVPGNMVVRAGNDPDAAIVRVVCEPAEHRDDVLRTGNVEFPVGRHEIDLGIDIPEH